jgi:tetratricopeptide (TPR) repeat protein
MMRYFWIGLFLIVLASCTTHNRDEEQQQALNQKDSVEIVSRQILADSLNAGLYYQRSRLFFERGMLNQSLRDIGKAIQLNQDDEDFRLLLADIYQGMNKFEDARRVLVSVANQNHGNVKANLKLAELELAMQNYGNALLRVRRALHADPNNAKAYYIEGYIHLEKGDTTRAMAGFTNSAAHKPDFKDPYFQLGRLYAHNDDAKALDYYNAVLNIDPEDTQAMYMMALYYQEHEALEKAEDIYHQILRIDSTQAPVLHNLGYIEMVYRQEYQKAILLFNKAIEKNPLFIQAWYNKGYCYELLGNYQEARKHYQKTMEIQPNYPRAIEGLNRLDNVIY